MTTAWMNATIYTGEDFAEAILTEDGRIKQVGSAEDILSSSPDRVVDLNGRFVLPGFNDSHLHLRHLGKQLQSLSLSGTKSIQELIVRSRQYLKDHPDRSRVALTGSGWNQDQFSEKRFPTKEELDQISSEIPVALTRVCGHVAVVNSRALEVLGLDASTPNPPGGIVEKKHGELTGLLKETALDYLGPLYPELTSEDLRSQFQAAFSAAVELGVTSAQSNDLSGSNTQALAIWNLLLDMDQKGQIPLRLTQQLALDTFEELDAFFEEAKQPPSDHLSMGPIKLYKDGSLGARTALMQKDYADCPGERGTDALSDESIRKVLSWAQENDRGVIIHVIGDGALERVLNLYEETEDPSRHGLVHCQISTKAQLERIKEIGCYVLAQPIFFDYDLKVLVDRVGDELAATSYAFGTLMRKGVSVSLGTDCPVEGVNPLPNLFCAIARTDLEGKPDGGFHPEHAMTLSEAIRAYTAESAYQEGQADSKGKLVPGYLADFVVLQHDPFQEKPDALLRNRVVMTVIGEKIVYTHQDERSTTR